MFAHKTDLRIRAKVAPLMTFDQCMLVELNARTASGSEQQRYSNAPYRVPLETFRALCEKLSIPRFPVPGLSRRKMATGRTFRLQEDEQGSFTAEFWDSLRRGSNAARNCICVTGSFLDDDVTCFCLESLAHGYDTYTVIDLVEAKEKTHSDFLWQRLFLSGVLPTTSYQIVTEWGVSEPDQSTSAWILRQRNKSVSQT